MENEQEKRREGKRERKETVSIEAFHQSLVTKCHSKETPLV